MKVVMLIDDNEIQGLLMRQWIETGIADVRVLWFSSTEDAEKKLQEDREAGVVGCIVLDMFFPDFTGREEPLGRHILEGYPDNQIVLISKDELSRKYVPKNAGVPLLHLDKPSDDWSSAGNPDVKQRLEEFRRDLVEAVKCALLVRSLQADVKHLKGKQVLRPFFQIRAFQAAVVFLFFCVAYALSISTLPQFVQHLLLTLCAVTGVHLLDRAILFRDFRDAFESVRNQIADLSVKLQLSAQEGRDKPPAEIQVSAREDRDNIPKLSGDETV